MIYKMTLKVIKLAENAILPTRHTPGSVGYDLYSIEDYTVNPGNRVSVRTGIQIGLPEGTYGRIAPKSGQSVSNGIMIGAGVVDPDYAGEIKVVLFNMDKKKRFVIRKGFRIAQLVIEKVDTPDVEEVESIEYASSDRGTGGFGSTGTN